MNKIPPKRRSPIQKNHNKTKEQVINVACAVIENDRRILLAKRPQGKRLGGHWEFPGGKREQDESIEDCLNRELEEELRVTVFICGSLPVVTVEDGHFPIVLHPFICRIVKGRPTLIEHEEICWIDPDHEELNPLAPGDREILSLYLERVR